MKVGIIGYGSQAKRIIKILQKLKIKPTHIFKPKIKKKDPNYIVDNIKLLNNCDALFICSPNDTHHKYISMFSKKYIFCEKPLVNNNRELIKIKNNKKLFVNYNYRFGYLSRSIENRRKFNLGNIISGHLIMSQGLASKKSYSKSWRSNIKNCKYGVFEILGVHLIDLIAFHFKVKKITKTMFNISKNGSAYDTSFFQILLSNKAYISCSVSYFAPFISKQLLVFENGYIEMNNKYLEIRGPRNTFDKKGFFKTPPLIFKKKFGKKNDYDYSLSESVKFFLEKVYQNKEFDEKFLKTSIFTNRLTF